MEEQTKRRSERQSQEEIEIHCSTGRDTEGGGETDVLEWRCTEKGRRDRAKRR